MAPTGVTASVLRQHVTYMRDDLFASLALRLRPRSEGPFVYKQGFIGTAAPPGTNNPLPRRLGVVASALKSPCRWTAGRATDFVHPNQMYLSRFTQENLGRPVHTLPAVEKYALDTRSKITPHTPSD